MFASGKFATAYCDRCDRRVAYTELRPQPISGVTTAIMVCDSCLDVDNPQYLAGRGFVAESEALEKPRPDTGLLASRGTFGWSPVTSFFAEVQLGHVVVN